MLIIRRRQTDPWFNLAAEEYIFREFSEDTFGLWQNENSVIVGKHQNTLAEINTGFIEANNIKVVRRLSGGGAVFHDLGNLNFTFTQTGTDDNLVNFRKYTAPILEVLQEMGVDARFEGRNDLTIGGLKFSGNAMHVWKNKVLHHGTLLFSSKMADLTQALKVDPLKFSDKAVKSVRSRVTNISEHLKTPMDVMEFAGRIQEHILKKYPDARLYELTTEDIGKINQLVEKKYSTWDWNFGYSPKYNFARSIRTASGGTLEINLDVHNGVISKCRIFGDYFGIRDSEEIEKALTGVAHREDPIRSVLRQFNLGEYFLNVEEDELIQGMF